VRGELPAGTRLARKRPRLGGGWFGAIEKFGTGTVGGSFADAGVREGSICSVPVPLQRVPRRRIRDVTMRVPPPPLCNNSVRTTTATEGMTARRAHRSCQYRGPVW
jgi:hypothetical protein